MTMVQLFDSDNRMLVDPGAKRQPFDVGGDYFRRLKQFAVEYLQSSGFEFSPLDPQDDAIRGLLAHATGKIRSIAVDGAEGAQITTMQSHVASQTRGNQLVKALKA
jgi:hypothetical protein